MFTRGDISEAENFNSFHLQFNSVVNKQKALHNLSLVSKRLSNQQDIERAEDDERQQLYMIKIPLRVVEESTIDYRLATNAQTVKFLGACNPA